MIDTKRIELFRERYPDLAECKMCTLYPCCTRLKICDSSTPWCSLEHRKTIYHSIVLAMENEFRQYEKRKFQKALDKTSFL